MLAMVQSASEAVTAISQYRRLRYERRGRSPPPVGPRNDAFLEPGHRTGGLGQTRGQTGWRWRGPPSFPNLPQPPCPTFFPISITLLSFSLGYVEGRTA